MLHIRGRCIPRTSCSQEYPTDNPQHEPQTAYAESLYEGAPAHRGEAATTFHKFICRRTYPRETSASKKVPSARARQLSQLKDGETVRLQPAKIFTKICKKGKVLGDVGDRLYEVQCNGNIYTRNRKFLNRSTAESESGDDTENGLSDKSEMYEVTVFKDNAGSGDQKTRCGSNKDVVASHQNRTRRGRVAKKPNRFGYSL